MVTAWLLGGVMIDDNIFPERTSCWKREDLVNVPSIIQYDCEIDSEHNIQYYRNHMGCHVLLVPYGEFNSLAELKVDYRGSEKRQYLSAYTKMRDKIAQVNKCSIEETNWVMPVVAGDITDASDVFEEGEYAPIKDGFQNEQESKELYCLIDAAFLYTTIQYIDTFVGGLGQKVSLSKYEQYQLSYYYSALQAVEKPENYLVNQEELRITKSYYDKWGISTIIEHTTNNIEQMMNILSFLSSYQTTYNGEITSGFLTCFGIVTGLEAIYSLLSSLLEVPSIILNRFFKVLIAVIIILFLIYFFRKMLHRAKQIQEFRRKTGCFRKDR